MAAIDYGVLIINDGKVINTDLFPTIIVGEYTITFYKCSLTIYKNSKLVENYFFGDKYSYCLSSVVGKIKVRTLSRRNRGRFITRINGQTIIFGYGIDPDKHKGYQKHIMNDYGFDKREKRIISNYLWEKENDFATNSRVGSRSNGDNDSNSSSTTNSGLYKESITR